MKKRFAIIIVALVLFLTTACSLGNTPTSAVERLLSKYNNQDDEIVVELEDYINASDLNEEQAKKYKEVYLKQFKDLKYTSLYFLGCSSFKSEALI